MHRKNITVNCKYNAWFTFKLNTVVVIDPLILAVNYSPIGGPEGVEGVVAAEEDVVERNPLPASKCTHNKPLTPGSEATTESPPNAPSALDGLSVLYLRNSAKTGNRCDRKFL
jgi:hypothetical protein